MIVVATPDKSKIRRDFEMKRFFAVLLTVIMLMSMMPAASLAAPQYAAVVGGWLRLRADVSFESDTITSYYTGTVVEIMGRYGDWYYVKTPDGRIGYMYGDFLKMNVDGSTGTNGTENAFVTSHNGYGVRLRKGPGTGYRVITTCDVGTPVTVLEQGTYWCRISVNGTVGYMMSQFLNFGSADQGNGNNTVLCYATIWSANGYGVRLRSGPSTTYGKIGVYSVGTTVAVLEKGTTWDRIRVGSRTGWMMNDFLIYQNANEVTSVSLNNHYPVVGDVMRVKAMSPSHATVRYEWYAGSNLRSTDSAYTVSSADIGKAIQLRITGTGAYSGSAWSAQTAAVIPAAVPQPKLQVADVTLPVLTEGYAQSQPIAVTLTNVGDADAVLQHLWTEGACGDCFVVNDNGSTVIKAGATDTTWTVQAKEGLTPGIYNATFAVSYNGGVAASGVKLVVEAKPANEPTTAPAPVAKPQLQVASVTLPALTEGYEQAEPTALTITNTGNADANLLLLWTEGTNGDCFIVNETGRTVVKAGKTNTTWTVQPKAGLAAGNYTATFVVSYDGGTATAAVNLTVGAKPTAAPVITSTPEPTEAPTPTPEPTEAPTPTPEPTEAPTPTPEPTEAPTPTPEPTEAPTPTPEPTEAPTPTPEPTEAPTPTPDPTATPEPEKPKLGSPTITWDPEGKSVTWTPVEGATGYKCYRVKANGEQSSKKTLTDTTYTFKEAGQKGDIFYVKAIDSTGTYEEVEYVSAELQ